MLIDVFCSPIKETWLLSDISVNILEMFQSNCCGVVPDPADIFWLILTVIHKRFISIDTDISNKEQIKKYS